MPALLMSLVLAQAPAAASPKPVPQAEEAAAGATIQVLRQHASGLEGAAKGANRADLRRALKQPEPPCPEEHRHAMQRYGLCVSAGPVK